mgnify:CR=1 FL=1
MGLIGHTNNKITRAYLAGELEELFHVPVAVENDVNAAALGEAIYGAGQGHSDFLCLTYGTGVGGAIIRDREIYHGSSFSAGEFGAMVTHGTAKILGNDFFDGCYERYASTTALVNAAAAYDPSITSGKQVFEKLEDEQIQGILDCWITEIVLGLTTLIHIFNPSCIILGGGIMVQPCILKKIKEKLYVENAFLAASRCLAPDIHSTYFFFASVEKCITG